MAPWKAEPTIVVTIRLLAFSFNIVLIKPQPLNCIFRVTKFPINQLLKPIHKMKQVFLAVAFCCSLFSFSQGTQLLRQPTLHEDDVVFVYANDLWKSTVNGGTAIRLTSDEGYESSPHFSNDGKMIAFTAQYDGNIDVFVMPSEGGEPKRLTYHPDGDFVQGWTPDGEVLFRSGRESQPTMTSKFFTVSTNGGLPKA